MKNSKEKPVSIESNIKEINDNINRIEGKYPFVITTAIAVLGVLPKLMPQNLDKSIIDIIILSVPILFILILSYIADLYRQVAILRGYASYLEEKSNKDNKNNLQLWNSTYIDKLMQNNGTNVLIMCSSFVAVIFTLYSYKTILLDRSGITHKNIIIALIVIALLIIVFQFSMNDRYRIKSYWLAKSKNEDIYRVLLFSEGKKLIAESGVGKVLSLQKKSLYLQNDITFTTDKHDYYNIVHINTFALNSFFLARKCHKKGIPVIITTHTIVEDFENSFRGTYSSQNKTLFRKWLKYYYNYADLLISPTNYVKELLLSEHYGITVPIKVVSNGVDNELFGKTKSYEERKEIINVLKRVKNTKAVICETDKIILAVGLYLERKGIEEFIKLAACAEKNEKYSNWKFIWAGHTNSLLIPTKISKAIRRARKLKNIIFTGYIEHDVLSKLYRNSDAFLMLTKAETECLAILEALSSKVPIIVRDLPVFRDWLTNDSCRKFNASLNGEDLTDKLVKLLEKTFQNDNTDMLNKGSELAHDRDLITIGKKLGDIYKDLYKSKTTID